MASINRKWRVLAGLGGSLAGLAGAYALAGFLLVPYLVQHHLWPLLSQRLGGRFEAARVDFDPLRWSAAVGGFSLQDTAGNALVAIDEVKLDVDWAASAKARALVASVKIAKPQVNIQFDRQGRPNYAFLLPQETQAAPTAGGLPFLLTTLDIEQGRLTFEDQSLGKGYKKLLSPVDLRLDNLGAGTTAHFTLDAREEGQPRLAARGGLRWDDLAVDGEIQLEDEAAAPLAAWLLAEPGYAVRGGKLSLGLNYRYSEAAGFELLSAQGEVKALSLAQNGRPMLEAGSINAQGLGFASKNHKLSLQSLDAKQLTLDLDGRRWAAVGSASARDLAFHTGQGGLALAGIKLDAVTLSPSAHTALEVGSLDLRGLDFDMPKNRLTLREGNVDALKLGWDGQPLLEAKAGGARDLALHLEQGAASLAHLRLDGIAFKTTSPVTNKEGKPYPFGIESLGLDGISADTRKQSLGIAGIQANRFLLAAWLAEDGSPHLLGLPPSPAGKTQATAQAGPSWQVKLGRVDLNDNTLVLRDFRSNPPGRMRLTGMNLLVKDFDSASSQAFWLGMNTGLGSEGRIALEGRVGLAPTAANLKLYVDDLSLPPFQAFLDQIMRVRMVKGTLNLNADIDYNTLSGHKLRIGGDLAVANFASVDKQEERDFLNWQSLRLNGLIYEDTPARLSIREAILSEPYARLVVGPGQRLNLVENLSPLPGPEDKPGADKGIAKTAAPAGQDKADDALAVLLGVFHLHGGNVDFADLTIKPTSFAVNIHDLNGDIRSLSSRQDVKSDVLLQGKLNHDATVRIFGKINPFSPKAFTDIAMDFNGVNLTTLSPYSAKFAGYRIEKGKLSMDLRYQLENQRLAAENRFVLDQLVLGERVDSPEATSLPVRMAVALLKDADGKIDLNLPISGDLGNPDVNIRGLLAEAATSLFRKLATSPLALLGSLVGGSAEEMGTVKFAPGAATLSGQEKDKLAGLAQALRQRPGLNLDIKGTAYEATDRAALAEEELARHLKNAKLIELGRRKGKQAEWDGETLSPEDASRLLTQLYRWKNPDAQELQSLRSGAALSGDLLEKARSKLLATWSVSEMDLRGLAQARGEAVRNFLVKEMGIDDQRIYLLDVGLNETGQKEAQALLSVSEP